MPDSPGSHDERDAGPPAAKRRKTDASHDEAWPKPIKYGKYGQEVPGKLRLKIVSCDGGEQQDPRYPALSLGCENILRHDRSVYSSSRPGCNIVLRHEDWTPFCLEKLHIVAPEDGFRYPVGRGIVHVAMNLDELQKYIEPAFLPPIYAQRQNNTSPSSPPPPPPPLRRRGRQVSPAEEISLYEALRDPVVNAAHERPIEEDDSNDAYATSLDDFFRRARQMIDNEICQQAQSPDPDLDEYDLLPPSVTISNDDELGPEETTSEEVTNLRNYRERLIRMNSRRHHHPQRRDVLYEYQSQLQARDDMMADMQRWYSVTSELQATQTQTPAIPEPSSSARTDRSSQLQMAHNRAMAANAAANRSGQLSSPPPSSFNPRDPDSSSTSTTINNTTTEMSSEELEASRRLLLAARESNARSLQQYNDSRQGAPPPPLDNNSSNHEPYNPPQPPRTTTNNNTSSSSPLSSPSSPLPSSVTTAHFTIRPDKHKVTLKFSPEVSGRFILLKLWTEHSFAPSGGATGPSSSSTAATSVDVQSVIAKGFGGMRFFAAQEVR
jgi:hypothetical protein